MAALVQRNVLKPRVLPSFVGALRQLRGIERAVAPRETKESVAAAVAAGPSPTASGTGLHGVRNCLSLVEPRDRALEDVDGETVARLLSAVGTRMRLMAAGGPSDGVSGSGPRSRGRRSRRRSPRPCRSPVRRLCRPLDCGSSELAPSQLRLDQLLRPSGELDG
jgi:hypothetical protein